jgi:hypothetical protein
MSARQRLMKRPSIHDTKFPRAMEELRQHKVPEPRGHPRAPKPPATQLINRSARAATPPRPIYEPLSPERQYGAPSRGSEYEPRHRRAPNPPATQLVNQEGQAITPLQVSENKPQQHPTSNPPATQIINRASPRKRKQPADEPPTQRVTRLQAKKSQERLCEQREASKTGSIAPQSAQPTDQTSSPRKKLKMSPAQRPPVRSKVPTNQATQAVTRSPRKNNPKAPVGPSENTFIEPTQLVKTSPKKTKIASSPSKKLVSSPIKKATLSPTKKAVTKPGVLPATSPTKRKQLIMILPNRPADTQVDHSDSGDDMQISAADRVKMSPRRAAQASSSKVSPKPGGARIWKPNATAATGSSGYDERPQAPEDNTHSASRSMSPEKPSVLARKVLTIPSTMSRSRGVIPDISNYNDFKKLQAQGDLP